MNSQYIAFAENRSDATQFPEETFMAAVHLASTQSSPASFDGDTGMMMHSSSWQQHMTHPSMQHGAPPSVANNGASSAVPNKNPLPLQKRRRVTRACDECRRKKIKCDGKQPCTHCTVYSYECTYDQPSNRRRNPAPQYIEALENRLQRTEALLKAILPDVDVNSPDFDPSKLLPEVQATAAAKINGSCANGRATDGFVADKDSLLDSMVEATARLDVDETGHVDFHGHSSGLTYLSHLNNQFGGLLGEVKLGSASWPVGSGAMECPAPRPSQSPVGENLPDVDLLPRKEIAKTLVETCLDSACVLMRFIHKPSFMSMVERMYEIEADDYEENENTFLPLFFMALGVGCLFVDDKARTRMGIEDLSAEALKFFNAGRRMIEMTDVRDIYSIQAVLLMIIYLQSSTRMSTCYSYIGIALSAAVRMGLHRAVPEAKIDPIEREVRKRIFWTCWKMDTYVGAILGLPKGIAPEDIDQEIPAEVDDEYITKEAILPQPTGTISTMVAANAHTRLLMIMAKIVRHIYPLKGVEASVTGNGSSYRVSQKKLHDIEVDLARWLDALPNIFKPGGDTPKILLRCQYLLKLSFAHVQMMLYRPFVHYISRPKTKGCDERPYAIAAACMDVVRKIVHTTDEMRRAGLLNGAYWFTIYTSFFAIITLVYYVLVNPPDATSLSILGDAKLGRDCFLSLGENMAARRCTIALAPIFDKISEKVGAELEKTAGSQKKRARTNPEDVGAKSPSLNGHSSAGTNSPNDSAGHSPTARSKPVPTAPAGEYRRLSSPPRFLRGKFTSSPDLVSRNSPFEQFQTAPGTPSQQQQSGPYQAPIASTTPPDLNAMMFPSPDPFHLAPQAMDPRQQYSKREPSSEVPSPIFPTDGNPYGSLEGNLLGPLPPYLLQGQQPTASDSGPGLGEAPQRPNEVDRRVANDPNSIVGQYFVANGGGDAMVPDFFRDEWDDVLMQQSRFGSL